MGEVPCTEKKYFAISLQLQYHWQNNVSLENKEKLEVLSYADRNREKNKENYAATFRPGRGA